MNPTAAYVLDALRTHTNVLLYGPPGTGKTHLMQQVANLFTGGASAESSGQLALDTANAESPFLELPRTPTLARWVTFHQSYSYEDFVVGLRPDPDSSKVLGLGPVPGVLLELAAFASQADHSGLLLIDEINRGNVSRIFGEFITLLEPGKRLGDDGNPTTTTVTVRLPYLRAGETLEVPTPGAASTTAIDADFRLPRRIFTLASMNSVDKSIAPLDTALRRRFHIISLTPSPDATVTALGVDPAMAIPVGGPADAQHVKVLAARALSHLNRGITEYLGAEFGLGQWYLKDLADEMDFDRAKGALANIFNHSIAPQLLELFQAQAEQLAQILGIEETLGPPIYLQRPNAERVDLGASSYLSFNPGTTDETIDFIAHVASLDGANLEA